ncbi:MAG TPA: alpha/beta fold hydrolase, partial [Burkholderiales bacterium]|nr:alpha/beta fold hydrolase [Burkholderiales bacterium]
MNQRVDRLRVVVAMSLALSGCAGTTTPPLAPNRDPIVTVDQFVSHISTVPAIAGQKVGIFVRQKAVLSHLPGQGNTEMTGRVVLFVHGGTVPSVPDYDLDYQDYNWMTFLAQAGFNVYAMDLSGYGSSPRPMMDDPCNANPKQQKILDGRPLKAACAPHYARDFNTIRSDWDEIDAVVNYVRAVNRVERIHMIGWSAGGPRVGGYVAQHPEKIDRVMLYAPSPTIAGPVPDVPAAGFPMSLQT